MVDLSKLDITAAIMPESAVQFRIMDKEHGYHLYDAAQLRDMHRAPRFRQIEIELCRFATTTPPYRSYPGI